MTGKPDAPRVSLRLLVVEDSENDALLILRELRRGGYDVSHQRVDTAEAMSRALDEGAWDAITCDYVMPHFSGLAALKLVQAKGLDLPFIVVSGKIGEETAVAAMKAGAQDFVMKDNLSRLVPALRREIPDAEERRERRLAQSLLAESEERYRTLVAAMREGVLLQDAHGTVLACNESAQLILGVERDGGVFPTPEMRMTREDGTMLDARDFPAAVALRTGQTQSDVTFGFETTAGEAPVWVSINSQPLFEPGSRKPYAVVSTLHDVTQLKRAEAALRDSERRFRSLIENSSDLIVIIDSQGTIVYASPSVARIGGYDPAQVNGRPFFELVHPDDVPGALRDLQALVADPLLVHVAQLRCRHKAGFWIVIETISKNALSDPVVKGIVINGRDITERKNEERILLKLNRALKVLSAGNEALVHATGEGELLAEMCRVVVEIGGYRGAWVELRPSGAAAETITVAFGLTDEEVADARAACARCRAPGSEKTQCTTSVGRVLHLPLLGMTEAAGSISICASEPGPFADDEVRQLEDLANDLGFGLSTLRLREDRRESAEMLRRSLESAVQAMASTVELRDPYTAGHQRRVAHLAVAIARAMGLDEERVHGLQLAGFVHDIGKINVPAEILSKPGQLNDIEIQLIRRHAQAGYEILKDIAFPWPIAEMVRQHHERLDGSGYPRGLMGDDILLEARILAVADTVEAMSSHRPYRAALGTNAALDEITRHAGLTYDRDAVGACVTVLREGRFTFT